MKAAILLDSNRLEIREIPIPACPEGGVLVRVKACGICSSDTNMVKKGHPALICPRIPGHEIAGFITESRSKIYKKGDRVQVAPGLSCGRCIQCRMGADNRCAKREILGFTYDGGFSQYIAVPLKGEIAGALTLLPENVSCESATLAEPLACCINAQDKIGIQKKDTVLIIGAGPLGLLHSIVAKHKGAEKVFIAEINADRRNTSVKFYADKVFDPKNDNLFQAVMDATSGKGVDIIIFACSGTGLDEVSIKMLTPGGRVSVFSGMPPQSSGIQMDSNLIHYNEIIITGAYGCSADQNSEAVRLISSGKFPVKTLITKSVSLDNIKEGLEYTDSKKGMKSIVEV